MFYYLKNWSINVDVLFCRSAHRKYRTVHSLCVLTLAPRSLPCSKRSYTQLDWREVWRQTASRALSPSYIHLPLSLSLFVIIIFFFLQIFLVSAQRQLMLQWTGDLMTCLWMKLEFSSCEANTMWPCWASDCNVILVRFRITFIDSGKRDLRMGKLQSKHGKKRCSYSTGRHLISVFWLWFCCSA